MDNEKVIFSKPFCTIWLNTDNKVLYAKWSGFLNVDETIEGCSVMSKFIMSNRVKFHLSNHIELKVLKRDVQSYLTMVWFPEIEKLGMKKVAALVAEDLFAKATVEKVNNEAKVGNLTINTFGSEGDCLRWFGVEVTA